MKLYLPLRVTLYLTPLLTGETMHRKVKTLILTLPWERVIW